ncbi:hypothetical protein ACWGCW_00895 [Streptomyces sp. NPDC054933]
MSDAYPDDQEPAYRCTHCPRLLHHDELSRYACRICEDRATEQVQALGSLYGQLERVLQPGKGAGHGGRVSVGRTAPLPVALQPLNLRGPGGIVTELQFIEDSWRRTLGWTVAPFRGNHEQTLADVVPFLVNNLPWACSAYEEVAFDLQVITHLHAQADGAVTGERDVRVPIGCCPVVHEETGIACGERLKVSPWALTIRCGGCGTQWQRDEWLRLGAAMRGLPVSTVAA